MLNFELEHGQLSNFQLRLVDRHSMAHSLEVRVPFLGKAHRPPLTRQTNGNEAIAGGKSALRKAAELTKLPAELCADQNPSGSGNLSACWNDFWESSQIEELIDHFRPWAAVLEGQEELALGWGCSKLTTIQASKSIDAPCGGLKMNLRDHNQALEEKREEITAWMKAKRKEVPIPVTAA